MTTLSAAFPACATRKAPSFFADSRWRALLPGKRRVEQAKPFAATRDTFLEAGDRLVRRCAQAGLPTAVVVFEQADLPELHAVFGADVARQLVAHIERKLGGVAGKHGIAVRTEPTVWTLLMPCHDRERALEAIRRALGGSFSIELDTGRDEIILVPDFVVECAEPGKTLAVTCAEAREKIRRAHEHEMRRQHYLRREHEWHCSTMRMPLAAPKRNADWQPFESTFRASLQGA